MSRSRDAFQLVDGVLSGLPPSLERWQVPTQSLTAWGTASVGHPEPEIEGFGPLPLPVIPGLLPLLEPHRDPVQPAVHRWHFRPEQVHMGAFGWGATLQAITSAAASGLGLEAPMYAELSELLVFGSSPGVRNNVMPPKVTGALGSLVVVLPSMFEGGEFTIRSGDEIDHIDLHTSRLDTVAWAAFGGGAWPEMNPLVGARADLLYTLHLDKP